MRKLYNILFNKYNEIIQNNLTDSTVWNIFDGFEWKLHFEKLLEKNSKRSHGLDFFFSQ